MIMLWICCRDTTPKSKHECPTCNADRDRYASSKNATSLARRFRDLAGLRYVLTRELGALAEAQGAALAEAAALQADCADPAPGFIEQAAHCGT